MSATPPTPTTRPRAVNVAFGCWVAADVLTAALGMLLISLGAQVFFYAAGGLLVAVGLAHGFLAGRARSGDKRFERAGVALALATVVLLAVLLLVGAVQLVGVLIVATIMILMITGSAMMQGKVSQAWFDSEAAS
jgi:hypothetical protein